MSACNMWYAEINKKVVGLLIGRGETAVHALLGVLVALQELPFWLGYGFKYGAGLWTRRITEALPQCPILAGQSWRGRAHAR